MAPPLGGAAGAGRRRVFVLVDKGIARGVFTSWEAAEAYADQHHYSLEHLLEFETDPDHPDHLHLLAAKWDGDWEYHGRLEKFAPAWPTPPRRVRLDHYQAKGDTFQLLRQKEFVWDSTLLARIDPMAPDSVLDAAFAPPPKAMAPPPVLPGKSTLSQMAAAEWRPKLAPLKTPAPAPGPAMPPAGPKPLLTEAGPSTEEPSADTATPAAPSRPPVAPVKPRLAEPMIERRSVGPSKPETGPSQPEGLVRDAQPRITLPGKKPLRLKTERPTPPLAGPRPIPVFAPVAPPPAVPVAAPAKIGSTAAGEQEPGPTGPVRVRRIWPLRLIAPLVAIVLCWAGGIWWALRPEPTAASILPTITSLANARVILIEPGIIYFNLPVDPIHQRRWIASLELEAIPSGQTIALPFFHTLETWSRPTGFVRPPYADIEVDEWWDLRLRKVSYGFYHRWDDGSIIVLDLESDQLIGWARARLLRQKLN